MSKRLAPKSINAARQLATYAAFDAIDGRHPWQSSMPDGYVGYPVRRLNRGKVIYFNFALAREMGLLSIHHGDELTPALAAKLIDTFSIQIVNEFDRENAVRLPKHLIKSHPHMATRYLQLQHSNKQGRTSGDGRSIWNGTYQHKGKTWDISSRGTGVTCLAPGAVLANRPLKTGAAEFGYGCGLADITELLGSAVFSEIFHLNGINTERVLLVIDLGKGCGIGVRAAPNLIRPAHLFLYLKQERLGALKAAVDYMIDRQYRNGEWKFSSQATDRYPKMLKEITTGFAKFAARLERDYIFTWMEWDGDNVLANSGIIDYGSIRQFGLRHDQYRYDDVERFSTNLNEQRGKARSMVQVFAQMHHYLETGGRRPIEDFANHPAVHEFDVEFERAIQALFLEQLGLEKNHIDFLVNDRRGLVKELYKAFLPLEKMKTKAPLKRLPDGINRPAIFNMRAALRELPAMTLREIAQEPRRGWKDQSPLKVEDFLDLIASSFAKRADLKLKGLLRRRIERFLRLYNQTLRAVCGEADSILFLKGLALKSEEKNLAGRITGNGAEFVVEEVLRARKRGLSQEEIQTALDLFIASQCPKSALGGRRTKPASLQSNAGRLFQELVAIAAEFQEDI